MQVSSEPNSNHVQPSSEQKSNQFTKTFQTQPQTSSEGVTSLFRGNYRNSRHNWRRKTEYYTLFDTKAINCLMLVLDVTKRPDIRWKQWSVKIRNLVIKGIRYPLGIWLVKGLYHPSSFCRRWAVIHVFLCVFANFIRNGTFHVGPSLYTK